VFGIIEIALTRDRSSSSNNTALGITLVALSTLLYALYTVLYKKWNDAYSKDIVILSNQDSEENDFTVGATRDVLITLQIVSLLGIVNFLTMWISVLIAYWAKIEDYSFLHSIDIFYFFLIGVSNSLYTLFSLLAIILIDPFFVSMLTLLTIPLSILSDYALHGKNFNPYSYFGVVLICASIFILVYKKPQSKSDESQPNPTDQIEPNNAQPA
jgi:drug/metabolite transporter (DMT)-like permease